VDFAYELIETYPDAKVILLTRDLDKWYESYMATVGAYLIEVRLIYFQPRRPRHYCYSIPAHCASINAFSSYLL
jgi:hypothetical protein